jgi:hypothetical protein
VRITHPKEFVDCLTSELKRIVGISGSVVQRVNYIDREVPGSQLGQINPAFVKPPGPFAVEKEVRAIWLTSEQSLKSHYVLTIPELCRYVVREETPFISLAA